MKKNVFFIFLIILFCTTTSTIVKAKDLLIYNEYRVINDDYKLFLYHNNVLIYTINDASVLDINDKYLLYNIDKKIYVYELLNNVISLITNRGYNALIYDNKIIFESDLDATYKCKNMVEMVAYANCFKLYS